jgi:hypothetical protein
MFELAGALVCACFFLCWAAFILANLIQIQAQRRQISQQTLNYYLSRINVVFAVGMFIENIATFADYFLAGEAFEVMYGFGTILLTLVSQIGLGMLSFITYQALLAASTLEVVENENAVSSLRRRFIAINVSSTLWSLVVSMIMHVLNKRWLNGLLKFMWALVILFLGFSFWYYFMLLVKTARTMAEGVGVMRVHKSFKKPVISTALLSVLVFGLIGSGTLDLLDMRNPHHKHHLESYVPVNELMLMLACTTTTFFAWLPLKRLNGSKKKPSSDTRCVF